MQQQQQQQQLRYYPLSAQAPVTMGMAQGPRPMLLRNGSGIRRIKARHAMFKVAVGILLLSMVLFLVGFFGAAWDNIGGLWRVCYPDYGCKSNVGGDDPGYLNAVRSMESFSLIALAASFGFLIYQDVVPSLPPPENKAVEIAAAIAGLFNMLGLIIYGEAVPGKGRYFSYDYDGLYVTYYLCWAFYVSLASCVLTLLAASAIAYSRVKHADRTLRGIMAAAGVYVLPTSAISKPSPYDLGTYPSLPTSDQKESKPLPPPYLQVAQPMMPAASSAMDQNQAPLPMSSSNVPGPSAVPLYYLVSQGHTIPVYDQAPQDPSVDISSPGQ